MNNSGITIQRKLKGKIILEVGYVGVFANRLFNGEDLNDVPWMMKLNGQTFAKAYDNLFFALSKGQSPAPQAFLEAALKGSSYCTGYASCTAAVAANESYNILSQLVTNLWQDLDSSWVFGPSLISSQQSSVLYGNTATGFSNFNALVVTVQKRMSSDLTLDVNFTMGHALGTLDLNQSYTLANLNDPWNPSVDYGNQYFDRKADLNVLANYNLPFGKGRRWANSNLVAERFLGGWSLSPIFSFGSGLPLAVYTGSFQEFGQGYTTNNGCQAIPLASMHYNNSAVAGVNPVDSPAGLIGVGNDVSSGGNNENLFSSSQLLTTFENFRPALVGIDGRCGGAGILRGQARWNLDLGLTKDTRINERVGFQFFVQAFNLLNHMQWSDPSLAINDPGDWGALYGQYGAQTLGGSGASENYTRIIQLGLRLRF